MDTAEEREDDGTINEQGEHRAWPRGVCQGERANGQCQEGDQAKGAQEKGAGRDGSSGGHEHHYVESVSLDFGLAEKIIAKAPASGSRTDLGHPRFLELSKRL